MGIAYSLVRSFRYRWFLCGVVLGCSTPVHTSPEMRAVAGSYLLNRVDGIGLPFSLPPEQNCSRSIPLGTLDLILPSAEAAPIFSWDVGIRVGCTPVPPTISQETKDFGTWKVSEDRVITYASDKGRGIYRGTHTPSNGTDLFAMVPADGHTYSFRRIRSADTPYGLLFVKLVDESNAPVAGATLRVAFPNGETGGGTTLSNGEFGLQGVVGKWNVDVTPPLGHVIASAQSNPSIVSVTRGVTKLIVHLARAKP